MNRRRAFTLIELLIVVAIIGLLAGLLLPALGRARERGRRAVCRSNLRQVAIAAHCYVDDNNGRFPTFSAANYANDIWRWAGNLTWATAVTCDDRPGRQLNRYLRITNAPLSPPATLAPDVSSPVRCPSDRILNGQGSYKIHGSSYSYNCDGYKIANANNGLDGATCIIDDVRTPSDVLMSADYAIQYAYWIGDGYGTVPGWKGPHQPGTTWGNGVFVDGHASWLHFDETGTKWWAGTDWTMVAH